MRKQRTLDRRAGTTSADEPRIGLSLPRPLYDRLLDIARREDRTLASMARVIVRRAIEADAERKR